MTTFSPFIIFTFLPISTVTCVTHSVGVNWGTMASHPLPPPKVVELLKSNNINKVKLFDANPFVLQALSGSNIGVTVGIPNNFLRNLNSSKKAADSWVHDNVTRYISSGGSKARIEEEVAKSREEQERTNRRLEELFAIFSSMEHESRPSSSSAPPPPAPARAPVPPSRDTHPDYDQEYDPNFFLQQRDDNECQD